MAQVNPWDSQIHVTPEKALSLIASSFPEFKGASIKLLGTGWDNYAYCINDAYVFRFPRRDIAVPLLKRECKILPKLKNEINALSIPDPEYIGGPTDDFPYHFMGYRFLDGKTACTQNLSKEMRMDNVDVVADFLKSLHSFNLPEAKKLGLDKIIFDQLASCKDFAKMQRQFEAIKEKGYIDNIAFFLDLAGSLIELEPKDDDKRLVHGDLYARHILVDSFKRICGVIDWGDSHIGFPITDFALLHSFFPVNVHDKFRNRYGYIDETIWKLSKLRAIYSSSLIIFYGSDIKDDDLIREGLIGLDMIAKGN